MKIAILRLENWINVRVDRLIYTLRKHFDEREDNIICLSPGEEYIRALHKLRGATKHIDLGKIKLTSIRLRIEPYYSWIKRKIGKILKHNRIDVVYAINIYSAMIAHELGYPLVLDDNEFYSLKEYVIGRRGKSFLYQFTFGRKLDIYKNYERILAQNHPVIAVSDAIAEYYSGLGASHIYVIQNLLSEPEYNIIEEALQSRTIVDAGEYNLTKLCYIGSYNDLIGVVRHRNLSIFLKIFEKITKQHMNNVSMKLRIIGTNKSPISLPNIETTGWIPHFKILTKLLECDFGILAWPPNPYNRYIAPHKGYLYIATGLTPLITSDMESYIKSVKGFKYYLIDTLNFENSIESILHEIQGVKIGLNERIERIKRARKELIWDKHFSKIMDALKKA